MSEIRENQVTGEWVIIAPERAKRGGNITPGPADRAAVPEFVATCPFCPGSEASSENEAFRVDDAQGRWTIRSVPNKFSVLSPVGEVTPPICPPPGEVVVNGVGLHEVLIESPRHDATLAQCPVEQVQQVLEAYRHRFIAFYADPRVKHVIVFKNHGAEAGASQQHPHSQIVGLPIVPGQVVDRLERAWRFFTRNGQCLGCSLLAQEREQQCRIITENEHFTAFIPHAALSPYHLWIIPRKHAACFSELPVEWLPALAEIVHSVLAKVHGLLNNPPFNLVVRSLSPADKNATHFHWYISIVPRVNRTAGFELGTGMYVNPSAPEVSAQALREFVVG